MKGQSKQAKIIIDCHSQVIRTSLESLEWWMVGEKDVISTERTWEVHKMKHGWGWLGEGLVISQHEPLLQWRIQLASQGKAKVRPIGGVSQMPGLITWLLIAIYKYQAHFDISRKVKG